MEERIGENIEKETSSPEQAREGKRDVFESQNMTRENKEPNKEAVLRDIYSKDIQQVKPKEKVVSGDEKAVGRFVKEFYSIGVKAIGKAKRFLGAYDLDNLHDTITNKNKSDKKQL